MPAYTLAQAIAATGKSRSTLIRAIRAGKISATRDAAGTYLVEPSELHRAFPNGGDGMPLTQVNGVPRHADDLDQFAQLKARLDDAHATIDDLRRRLDVEADERRRLTTLLADKTAPAPRRWRLWKR